LKTILATLGWNSGFEAEAARRSDSRGLEPARVIERTKDSWTIALAAGSKLEERTARASGSFLRGCSGPALPVTGDWVLVKALGEHRALIEDILPRRTRISRKAKGETGRDKVQEQVLVANIDLVVIVAAAGLDWNARRMERYLALAHDSGAKAAVVVTKADLAADTETLLKETQAIAPGVEVLALSALSGFGMEKFAAILEPGKTAVLIGSSGSGKSTLLNRLAGNPIQAVQDVREDDHKGRHTTSSRSLFILPSGALLIDTPGLREVQLWTDEKDVDAAFPEIEALAARCRFKNCSHGDEPGCAVRQAIRDGLVDERRLAGWKKLRLELSLLRQSGGPASINAIRNQCIKRERKFKAGLRNQEG
jgi:ribosome biogenesis GTPase